MRVWRITRAVHADLSGAGGFRFSGRWHRKGVAVVYTSMHLSLAVLESRVHLAHLPSNRVAVEIDIPGEAREIEALDGPLPIGWPELESATQDAGMRWLASAASAACSVPSVVVARERNVLLNPAHPGARHFRVVCAEPFTFDPRLFSE